MRPRPFHDRVLISPDEVSERRGSIFLPDAAKERPASGTVMAFGPECKYVRAGQKIFYSRYQGWDVEVPGVGTFLVIAEKDVLLGLEEEDDGTAD